MTSIKRKPDRYKKRSREQIKTEIDRSLRSEFQHDTVDVSDGYRDNIHVLVVSRKFDNMTERRKQEYLWSLIDSSALTDREKTLISLVYPLSPGELK